MRYLLFSFLTLSILFLARLELSPTAVTPPLDEAMPVWKTLVHLGEMGPNHMTEVTDPARIEAGRKLVTEGFGEEGGKIQSKHFKCTSCHNIQREDPDLRVSDPEARLDYVVERKLPFLPGTTLWGIVNRSSFYNGDYEKKYGDLVFAARHDLRGAVQLCATECAQGRALEKDEMENVIAYLWTLQYRLADLDLSEETLQRLADISPQTEQAEAEALREEIKAAYLPASPATFLYPPEDRKAGYAETGDARRGRLVYDASCLHCHQDMRYSYFDLDGTGMSLKFMAKHFPEYTRYSSYQVIRYGTSPIPGKRAYMPHYTAERMSDGQVEDLRAYVEGGPLRKERAAVSSEGRK